MSAIPNTDGRTGTGVVEPPSFWRTARTPRWIAALLLSLGVAAGFAALGQWQIGRAAETAVSHDGHPTRVVPLASLDTPQTGVSNEEGGRLVSFSGRLVPEDTVLLPDRLRVGSVDPLGGQRGWWVVGRAVDSDGDSLAVALGWAPTKSSAQSAERELTATARTYSGRYQPPESPDSDDVERGVVSALSTAALVNRWTDPGPVYSGFLVAEDPASGLQRIVAPAPEQEAGLNWLNVFYAVEWALFAGFAVYLWVRLVKDAVEREQEALATPAGDGAAPRPTVD